MGRVSAVVSLACSVALSSASLSGAVGGQGTTAADVLKVNYGPRPVGMGGAFIGLADDVNAMAYNAAGLLQLSPSATLLQLMCQNEFCELN